MAEPNEMYIVYRSEQMDEARERTLQGARIVCFDFWIERELTKQNIPYISLRDVVDAETGVEAWWLRAEEIAREWYRLPALQFFEYHGIRIAEISEPILGAYLTRLFYFVRVCQALKKKYPSARFSISPPRAAAPSMEDISSLGLWAVIDAARMTQLPGEYPETPKMVFDSFPSSITRKSILVRIYNAIIGLFPRRTLKIYASEFWAHIAPVMEHMDDTELILLQSGELRNIPWRQLIAHRVRIQHPADIRHTKQKQKAIRLTNEFIQQWTVARQEVAAYLLRMEESLDWNPVLDACDSLMRGAARDIADIDALYSILKKERPDVVLELASVGGRQQQYFLMARIAAQLGVPSVELQHAAATVDRRQAYSRIETSYLASYGSSTNSWYERIGYASDRLIPVGSPRFDRCLTERTKALEKGKSILRELGLDPHRPVLLAAVPFCDSTLFLFDSYQVSDFFAALQTVQDQVPGLQILFKFRNNYVGGAKEYVQELFPADMAIARSADLFALACASDVAVCGFSTVLYEVLLAETPLVLSPWKQFDSYQAHVYESAAPLFHTLDEGVSCIVRILTDESYHTECLERQKQFLKGYSFDGHSSGRIATFLRKLARRA